MMVPTTSSTKDLRTQFIEDSRVPTSPKSSSESGLDAITLRKRTPVDEPSNETSLALKQSVVKNED